MDSNIYGLLNDIPEHADYAVEAGDLDSEGINGDRPRLESTPLQERGSVPGKKGGKPRFNVIDCNNT